MNSGQVHARFVMTLKPNTLIDSFCKNKLVEEQTMFLFETKLHRLNILNYLLLPRHDSTNHRKPVEQIHTNSSDLIPSKLSDWQIVSMFGWQQFAQQIIHASNIKLQHFFHKISRICYIKWTTTRKTQPTHIRFENKRQNKTTKYN